MATAIPLPLFASVMGLSGLGLVWHQAEQLLGWSGAVTTTITITAGLVFIALVIAYLRKVVTFRTMVRAELSHPVRINFLPAVSISLILLGLLMANLGLNRLSLPVWMTGAGLQLALLIFIVHRWLSGERPMAAINPAWFIPAVGNILVPLVAVPAGYVETAWFFFSIGLFFWVILSAAILHRLVTGPALEPPMLPSLAVLIAPPSVGFLSWLLLAGELNSFGRILFYIGVGMVLILLPRIPSFLKLRYFPSWWAYTFPLAAFTVSCFRFDANGGTVPTALLLALTALTTLVVLIVAARTIKALINNETGH